MSLRSLHVSWHIAACSCGVLAGAALSASVPPLFAGIEWLLVAITVLGCAFRRSSATIVLVLLAGIIVGLWRGGSAQIDLASYTAYYHSKVDLHGKVAEDPTLGPDGKLRLQLSAVKIDGTHLPGLVWVSTASQVDIKRGDAVTFSGTLGDGFGTIAATMYRARLVEATRPTPGDFAREARDWFTNHIRSAIPEPQASLGIGFLVGQQSTLPEDLNNNIQLLGLTHVVVASGYNLTILIRLARQTMARVSKYMTALAAGGLLASFILITGLTPSMSRAGLVVGLSLAAWYYGRVIHPFVLLPFSAAITVVINPSYIWGDIGWYLSFTAFTGVIVLAPLLRHYFWGNAEAGTIKRILIETSSAQLLTMPIIAFVFGQYAPLALPANMLILPFVPITMLFTFLAGVGAALAPALEWFGYPARWLLDYMTAMIDWLASLPPAASELAFDSTALVASYILLAGLIGWLWRTTKHRFSKDSIIE